MATTSSRNRVHVGGLRQRLGQRLEVDISESLPGMKVIASQTTDKPIVGTLSVESIERGVSVTGTLLVEWESECRRCLEKVKGESQPFVDEVFQVHAPEDSDIIDFDGDTIILDDIIRDNAMASLPLSPLCSHDCKGPEPERYPAGTDGHRPEGEKPESDPRWAALADLDFQLGE